MIKELLRKFNRRDPGICRDVKCWCIENLGVESVPAILQPSRRISRGLPKSVEAGLPPNFAAEAEFQTYERFVARIPGARIAGRDGFVILPNGQFAFEHITHYEPFMRNSPVYFQRFSTAGRRKRHWAGSYFSILGTFCETYYHWLHDVLTQFHQVLEYLPPATRIVVPANLSQTQKRTLQALGIAEERLAYFHPNDEVTVEELYFIPPPTITRFDDPEPMNWLRNRLREGFGLGGSHGVSSRRIYISRSKAGCRRVVNEERLMTLLSGYGFELVHCEDLSIEEQARRFSDAESVIAPHGAGLTNLLFSNAGLKALEVFPESLINTHYWSLTGALNQTYSYLCGKSVPNGSAEHDIFADLDKMRRALDALDVRPL